MILDGASTAFTNPAWNVCHCLLRHTVCDHVLCPGVVSFYAHVLKYVDRQPGVLSSRLDSQLEPKFEALHVVGPAEHVTLAT